MRFDADGVLVPETDQEIEDVTNFPMFYGMQMRLHEEGLSMLDDDPEAETPTEPVAVVAWWRDTPDVLEAQSTLLSELTAESEAWRKAGEK